MSIDTMSHDQAVSSHAVERYVLGELSDAERESFEGHYFDCPDCFHQIELDGQFLAHAREVLDPEPEKSWLAQMLGDLRRPAPVFVSALLLCTLGIGVYQQSLISGFRAPRVEANYFLPGVQKGAGEKVIDVSRKSGLSLSVDFTPSSDFVSYRADIVTQSGKVKYSLPVAPREGAYTVTIGMPADALAPGQYRVKIQGVSANGTATQVGSGAFELKFSD
jgi:hypothetical protein